MKVYTKGQSAAISLTQRDYVGEGGEGRIYQKGGVAFKVYFDPKKVIPLGKIQELSQISDPRVIKPERVLTDDRGKPIGYTYKFVKDAWSLCQIFPRAFRDRNGISFNTIQELVKKMHEGVENVHKSGILIVDLNEMNFLIPKKFDDVMFIDVDSYQTKSYPATAIMPSVKDWKVKKNKFTTDSDWYSFGIVTFQMFTGIHPYKGRYKKKKMSFDERMQQGISVFNQDVGVPKAAYPFDVIPKGYREWYEAIFENGRRCAPPMDIGAAMIFVPKIVTLSGTQYLDITEIGEYDGDIKDFWSDGHKLVVATTKAMYVDKIKSGQPTQATGTTFTPRGSRPVQINGSTQPITMTDMILKKNLPFGLTTKEVSYTNGRMYIRTADRIHEVIFTEVGNTIIPSTKEAAQVLEHATRLYPGVAIQNLLGSVYVSLLPESGKSYQIPIKELDGYRIVDAKFEGGVLMVVGQIKGKYNRLVFRFDLTDQSYDVREVKDIQPTGLNFVTLDSGVCVSITEDEKMEAFSSRKNASSIKIIDDPVVGGDMKLGKHAGAVVVSKGNKMYKVRMK